MSVNLVTKNGQPMRTEPPKEEKKHAKFSPSSAHRWVVCPASVLNEPNELDKKKDQDNKKDNANEGTLAHEVLEMVLAGKPNKELELKATQEMIDHAFAFKKEIAKMFGLESDELHANPKIRFQQELKVGSTYLSSIIEGEDYDFFGTIDVLVHEAKTNHLYLFDYKYGRQRVDVRGNMQLLLYALYAMETLFEQRIPAAKIFIGIYQPRAGLDNPLSIIEVDIAELQALNTEILSILHLIKHKDKISHLPLHSLTKPLTVSGDHCQWCPSFFACQETQNALNIAANLIPQDAGAIVINMKESELKEGKLQDAMKIEFEKMLLKNRTRVTNTIKALHEAYKMRIEGGEVIEGLTLSAGRTKHEWINEEVALAKLKEKYVKESISKEYPLTPTQIKEKIKKLGEDKLKEFEMNFGSLIVTKKEAVMVIDSTKSMLKAADDFDL